MILSTVLSSLRPRARSVGVALLLLAGCSVGPDYVRPEAPTTPEYQGLQGWKQAEPQDTVLRGQWWEMFNDPLLNDLEQQELEANQNLIAAEANFRQARALVWGARSAWYPSAALGVSMARTHQSSNGRFTNGSNAGSPNPNFSDYSMPLSISWELDIWGRIRRSVEANTDTAQASAADVESARLSLQTELARDYFQLRTLDAQRDLLDQTADAYERSVQLTRSRYVGGVASGADVALAETQLQSTRARAIDVGVQRAALEHAIATLTGQPASSFSIPAAPLANTPPPIPVGVPSELLERRPDIATAERLAAAANAQVGVATSAYYPTVTLSADGGFESSHISDWFTWPSRFWSVGPSINEVVFDGGLRAAQTEQARAAYDANVAGYRQSVLAAFQEVEDNLSALRILEHESGVQDLAVQAARDSLRLTTNRYKEGNASYSDVIITQTAALVNESTAVDILGRRMVAAVQLITAVGGGWNAGQLPTSDDLAQDRPLF